MAGGRGRAGYDGTTGGTDHGGRRTHIIQILRDSKSPVSVAEVAELVGIHVNTARFHLESLADAGLATREQETRATPGRPKILYTGTLPNQTHERAQGYRLLAEMLTMTVAQHIEDAGDVVYEVGRAWGRYLTTSPAPFEQLSEEDVLARLVDKMDALWFAPEMTGGDDPKLYLHNCPFLTTAERNPEVVCSLHGGLINGSLAELGSTQRAAELHPLVTQHLCYARMVPAAGREEDDPIKVVAAADRPAADQPIGPTG